MPPNSSASSRPTEPLTMALSHEEVVLQLGQYYGQGKYLFEMCVCVCVSMSRQYFCYRLFNRLTIHLFTPIRQHKAKRQILRYQSATSGLFPRLSNDQQDAHIRDSIYCAAAVWSLYVAYTKRIDDDKGKAHDLGQSVVKCMRGILFAWMRQSEEKVESFKANQSPKHALHSKFR